MPDPKALELSVVTFTTEKLEIKVKNSSTSALDVPLTIEIYMPSYLVLNRIAELAKEAAKSLTPPGVKSIADVVTAPEGWSVWARRETSDSSVVLVFFNDLDQKTGNDLAVPTKLAAGAEFIIPVPLNPKANRARVSVPYSYQALSDESGGKREDGQLQLIPSETPSWTPEVEFKVRHATPTMIPAGTLVKIEWRIKDGVSAMLRGPLPGGNTQFSLDPDPDSALRISDGVIEVRVVSAMTFVLQAEVKPPSGPPNVQVVKMVSLDTSNKKHSYIDPHPLKVLPYGLIEIDWAAWGVKQVEIDVSNHTTRVIKLTQQTIGRSYEGTGIMRVTARKTNTETVIINAPPEKQRSKIITVVSWETMAKPDVDGHPWSMAMIGPKLGLLTFQGLYIADVGEFDLDVAMKKLMFEHKVSEARTVWAAMAAVDNRFVCLRRIDPNPDFELAAFTPEGKADDIPPFTLPGNVRIIALSPRVIFDVVGFGGRVYVVVEHPHQPKPYRHAFSVKFNSATKKTESRNEPWLEWLMGYRLVVFDNALYALNRETGRMFRFELTKAGTLDTPREAAPAVRKTDGNKEESMIKQGLIVPVGRVLVVMGPSSVPSVDALEEHGLHNVLGYRNTKAAVVDPNSVPQDLVYNPQKNYWGRCGHDLDIPEGSVAAFREEGSPRLWVVKPNLDTHTLAVGSESLFAHDYILDLRTEPLHPHLNKTRQFKIKNTSNRGLIPISDNYRNAGIRDFSAHGPAEILSAPIRNVGPTNDFTVEVKFNEIDPAPITLRYQLRIPQTPGSRTDCDYVFQVMLSGPNLSTVASSFHRIGIDGRGRLLDDEMFESHVSHAADSVIEVSLPKQLMSGIPFVIANTSKFDLKLHGLTFSPGYVSRTRSTRVGIEHNFPDCSFTFDPQQEANGGETHVNFNFAMPPGVEVSSGNVPQTKRVRLDLTKSKLMRVVYTGLVKPGDPPLRLQGVTRPIEAMEGHVVYVCQIGDTL